VALLCLAGFGHSAPTALDLFNTATVTKSERDVNYSEIMNAQPTQETAEK
jgi:hypothetical protein